MEKCKKKGKEIQIKNNRKENKLLTFSCKFQLKFKMTIRGKTCSQFIIPILIPLIPTATVTALI